MDAIRLDAEPLQPALPGRGTGDDSAVSGRRDRDYSVESAGQGAAGASMAERGDEALGNGQLRQHNVRADRGVGSQSCGATDGAGEEAWRVAGVTGAGVDAGET